MFLKIALLIIFFAVMIAVGLIARRQATDVNGFVLGGRSVGPWLTARIVSRKNLTEIVL